MSWPRPHLCKLARLLGAVALVAAAPAPASYEVDAPLPIDDARILRLGRHVLDQAGDGPRLRLSWPGTGIGLAFSGTEVRIQLADVEAGRARAALADPAARRAWRSHWSVAVDGQPATLVVAPDAGGEVVLAQGLSPGPHTLWLTKRTEAFLGASCLGGLRLSEGGRLLPPPPRLPRRIEVAGASNETGYGILGRPGCSGFRADEQDQGRAWPQLLADRVGAELINTAFSGKGLARNHPAANSPALTLPALWQRADAGREAPSWDFGRAPADAVIVDLGGNDWAGFGGVPDREIFEAALEAFLREVRVSHPHAWVVVALNGGFSGPERGLEKSMLEDVVARRRARGDLRLTFFAFRPDRTPGARRACDGHPSAAIHRRMAGEMARELGRLLGWPQRAG